MRVTQQMVADGAGVSIATVSRALAGHPAIPPTTRQLVQKVARRLGYQLNGRQQRRPRRVNTVGVLVAANAASLLGEAMAGVSAAAGTADLGTAVHVLAGNSTDAQREQIAQWPVLAAGGLQGVIAIGWWSPEVLEDMLGTIPFVVLGDAAGTELLRADSLNEVNLLHDHLRQLGHRQIGFCHQDVDSRDEALLSASFGHAERNLGSKDPIVVASSDHPQIRKLTMSRITAWICSEAKAADQLAGIIAETKLTIPRDVSIVAVRDRGRPQNPRWTSISYDWQSGGALALSRLQARIAASQLPPTTSFITGTLGPDTSSAPPPGARAKPA